MSGHPTMAELDLYAAGMLEHAERAAIGDHVAGCAECRPGLASAEDLAWELALAAERPAPAALRERIVAAHQRRRSGRSLPRIAFAAGAALVIVIALALTQPKVLGLSATPNAPARARASVVVVAGQAFLLMDVPPPPEGKAYEAWVIRGGTPIAAGVAEPGAGVVVLRLTSVPAEGDIAAVTVEDASGVSAPTSPPILAGKG